MAAGLMLGIAVLMTRVFLIQGTRGGGGIGAIQFRLSEAEFSRVSRMLLLSDNAYITYTDSGGIEGDIGNVRYSLKSCRVREGTPMTVNVTIPEDNHIRTMADFEGMGISGTLMTNSSSNVTEPLKLDVTLSRVSMVAEGKAETIDILSDLTRVILRVPSCRVLSLTFATGSQPEPGQTGLTNSEIEDVIKDAICQMIHLKFSLGFEEAKLDIQLEVFDTHVLTRAVSLQIKNSTVIVTQVVQYSAYGIDVTLSRHVDDVAMKFPPLRENSDPFEIWMNEELIAGLWRVYKAEMKIGQVPISLNDLLPVFDGLQGRSTDAIPYLYQIYYTFPNATVDIILIDADVSLNVTEETLQFNFNITGRFAATLNCNRTRTYSIFDFNMQAFVPTQIGTNNKALTTKYFGFGGNFTILSSNIGHVADRQISVTFYALPQIVGPREVFESLNANVKGISIQKMLPVGLYLDDISLSLAKNHIIIGGRLSDTSPRRRDHIDWVGDLSILDYLTFPLSDNTPDDLDPLPEQNCHVPETVMISGSLPMLVRISATHNAVYISTIIVLAFFL